MRQLDRVSRAALARAWAAGGGHGSEPLTIDLASTVCETYVLSKEGAQRHNYAGVRGYHPLLAFAAGAGDVLMARLCKRKANTARGAANFLRETVSRVRYAGAAGQLTMRADSGFYTHAIVAVCRKTKVRYSITVRQQDRLRNLVEAIPEADWVPIPYWVVDADDVAEMQYTPFSSDPDAVPVASSSAGSSPRPAPNWRSSPPTSITPSSPTERATPWIWRPSIAATPRSRMPSAISSTGWASTICPRSDSPPMPPGCPEPAPYSIRRDGSQPRPLDGTHWSGRVGAQHQDPPTTLILPGRTHHSSDPPPHPAYS